MTRLTSTETKPLEFNPSVGETKQKAMIPGSKIGWLHSLADTAGATFDITIRDVFGRVKFQRKGFGNGTEKSGELVNLPTAIGEELEVEVSNLKGAEKVHLFLN